MSIHVTAVEILFLLGLDMMTKLKLIINFDNDIETSKLDDSAIQLSQNLGHTYID